MASAEPTISTHVLDTGAGRPIEGILVTLYKIVDGQPIRMSQSLTDADGRVADLLGRPLQAGEYRLQFGVAERSPFFSALAVDLQIEDTGRSYHVPLLVAPYGLSTYRGS